MTSAASSLKGVALERWLSLYPALKARKTLAREEEDMLAVYCEAYASWLEAAEKVRTTTSVAKDGKGGIMVNPWVTVREDAASRMERLAKMLGLSPDSRLPAHQPTLAEYLTDVCGNEADDGEEIE